MARKRKRSKGTGGRRLDLASAFPPASDEAWRGMVARILGDGNFDRTLVHRTYDGIAIQPLYTGMDWHSEDETSGFPGLAPFTRGHRVTGQSAYGWDVRQLHVHPDRVMCNKAILEDLERGVTSVDLQLDAAGRSGKDGGDPDAGDAAGVGGVMISSIDDLDVALKGVHLDACPVGLRAGAGFLPAAFLLFGLLVRRSVPEGAFAGGFNADPLGALATMGSLDSSTSDALNQLGALARHVAAIYPAATSASVDATGYHDAGASEAQELACAVATGVAYLRAMVDAGVDLETAFGQIAFTYAVDGNLFLSIAKLRSARRLWARVAEASGAPLAIRRMRLQAVTSSRMLAKRDPWVNILRGTVAALAASVAGVDSLTVLPFTAAIGLPDGAARRIARNTQLVLQEESSLHRVVDPAGGAWAVETLTEAMAQEAWRLFQEIEREGGMAAALEAGRIQARIAEMNQRRSERISELDDPLTGTSTYPNLAEAPVVVERVDHAKLRTQAAARLKKHRAQSAKDATACLTALANADATALCGKMVECALAGATLGALYRASARGSPARAVALTRHRPAEAFEALRDASDAQLERAGKRPTVFLANIGNLARHGSAASYARNFLAAGGIEGISGEGGSDVDVIAKAFRSSGADVAVICSDDTGYRELGADLAQTLRKAGAREIYVVGQPGVPGGMAGADGFLHDGCDILAILGKMLSGMGISG